MGVVVLSPPSGTFAAPFTVSMTTTLAGAEIRYTTNGQAPTSSSTLYDGTPVPVSETTRFLANAFVGGAVSGVPTAAFYVQRSDDLQSDLPLIVIDDYGAGPPGQLEYEDAALMVFEPKQGVASPANAPDVAARTAIRVRGQTSAEFDKKGYRLELRDDQGLDADYSLLGMPAESDWVLNGPYPDKSLIRDAFAYGLGRDLGLFAPRLAYAELYLNTDDSGLDADDYAGVYLLIESVKNSPNRLDLRQLDATNTALPEITGGYIFKFELDVAEPPILACAAPRGAPCWIDLEVSDPSPLIAPQQAWLTAHLQAFHDTLFGDSFADPTSGYASYIELDSFVSYMLLQEVTRNLDAYIRSLYFHKDRDGKIVVGPLWDYNLIAGAGCCGSTPIEGWQHEVERNGDANGWFQRLLVDPAFESRLRDRYLALRSSLLSDAQIDARIDALAAPLANAAERNFERWPILTQETVVYFETPTAPSWQGQVEALRTWLKARLAWLDEQW
jgi:hypothetical protein